MSLSTTQQITLDLTVPRVQNVRCVQDDQNTRLVRIVVTNNGEPFPLNPETMTISYKVCKPDSRYVWNKTGVTINDDGTVTVDLSDQALAITGIAKSALKIQEGEEKISTLPFHIIVEKAVVGNDELISESESDILDEMESHLTDYNNPHKTNAEQIGLGNVPNVTTNDQTPTYTEAAELTPLTSGETLSAAFGKLAKAVAELIKHLSDKFIHITDEERTSWNFASQQTHTHGNQSILDGISSASVSNWNDKYTKNEIDNKFSTLETNIDWKESVSTYDDIAAAYPDPQDGWTVNVKDTDYTYRYNGLEWVAISANAIPKATSDIDGLMSKEDKIILDNLSGSSVTGVKGAAETDYRQGNINLTPENIGLGNVPNVATNDQTPTFTETAARENITSGEKISTLFGKIMKWFSDLKAVAFTGSYNDLTNKPTIPAAVAVKGNAESSYRIGNVNLTPANIGALPSSYVLYGNTAAVAGYALDARHANPNISGSLQAQINAANTALTTHKTSADHDSRYVLYNNVSPTTSISYTSPIALASSADTKVLTATASATGKYLIHAQVTFAANASGYRRVHIRNSSNTGSFGAVRVAASPSGTTVLQVMSVGVATLTAGTSVCLYVQQNSGSSLNTNDGYLTLNRIA